MYRIHHQILEIQNLPENMPMPDRNDRESTIDESGSEDELEIIDDDARYADPIELF